MPGHDFDALRRLREQLAGLREKHRPSLEHYLSTDGKGFAHLITKLHKASMASTATCVTSLVAAGQWSGALAEITGAVAKKLTEERTSADLPEDNPFSLSFMAEGIIALRAAAAAPSELDEQYILVRDDFAEKLAAHVMDDTETLAVQGAISIKPYPPSAYLTQLVHRVLRKLEKDGAEIVAAMHRWSRTEINKQIALAGARSRSADPLQLAYALILATNTLRDEQSSPEDKEIFSHALDVFFEQQLDDGSWPLSRPMFHYKEVGSAYCFDFELLVQLLSCGPLREDLLRHVSKLEKALSLAQHTSYDLAPETTGKQLAWASGHHPQLPGPESWSTASVYHFAHEFDRLVAEGVRRALFEEIGEGYKGPPTGPTEEARRGTLPFGTDFLDADLYVGTKRLSFRDTLANYFVKPIARTAANVSKGGNLGKDTPMSAILFGPPGTSKTQLAKLISEYLGWPLIVVDPSYLVQEGLDQVQAMANRLFSMLATVEEVVVLLDEFDEMGRDRTGNVNLLSRFITTAMLPKLIAINDAKKIVFLLATNYVAGFDAAFSREGRFDMRLQVMQPSAEAKLSKPDWKPTFDRVFELLEHDQIAVAKEQLGDLTFLETKRLVGILANATDATAITAAFENAFREGTLQKSNDDRNAADGDFERKNNNNNDQNDAAGNGTNRLNWKITSERDRLAIRLPPALDAAEDPAPSSEDPSPSASVPQA